MKIDINKIKLKKTYHFVLPSEMKKKIEVFSEYQGLNITESMMFIIKKTMPWLHGRAM